MFVSSLRIRATANVLCHILRHPEAPTGSGPSKTELVRVRRPAAPHRPLEIIFLDVRNNEVQAIPPPPAFRNVPLLSCNPTV